MVTFSLREDSSCVRRVKQRRVLRLVTGLNNYNIVVASIAQIRHSVPLLGSISQILVLLNLGLVLGDIQIAWLVLS